MNIIIVSKFLKSPRNIALSSPPVVVGIAFSVLLLVALGASLAVLFGRIDQGAATEAALLRAELSTQQGEIEAARADIDRQVDAMATRLGELQAQATRLNALGFRLTQVAGLEEGEFDFSESPAIGGPESSELIGTMQAPTLQFSLDAMAQRLADQAQQLSLLESLLIENTVDIDLRPAGLPVRTGYASSPYGARIDPFTGRREFHRGMDFNGERGSDVMAVADGVIAFSGRHNSYGNMVDIDHGNGYMTRYAHNSENTVKPGQRVRAGEVIGKMGATGRATGNHVHFEVWHNDRSVNPRDFLKHERG